MITNRTELTQIVVCMIGAGISRWISYETPFWRWAASLVVIVTAWNAARYYAAR